MVDYDRSDKNNNNNNETLMEHDCLSFFFTISESRPFRRALLKTYTTVHSTAILPDGSRKRRKRDNNLTVHVECVPLTVTLEFHLEFERPQRNDLTRLGSLDSPAPVVVAVGGGVQVTRADLAF